MPNYQGSSAPTSNVWDVSEIYQTDVTSPEFKELLVRLYQNLNLMSNVLSSKDSGTYDIDEFDTGQLFFPNPAYNSSTSISPTYRPVIRKVINFGALPNAALKTVAHNITFTDACTMTRIYGVATDPVAHSYLPLPYVDVAGAGAASVELYADNLNVGVRTASNRLAYTRCMIVLEYLKT